MKLKISAQHDVQILSAQESVSAKDIQVLRAGISKFFSNGKNKIVIELPGGASIQDEALRELSILDVLARELSGRIVLVCADPQTLKRVENFAKPPLVLSVATIQEAIEAFTPPPLDAPAEKPAVTPPAAKPAPAKPAAPSAAAPAPTLAPGPAPEAQTTPPILDEHSTPTQKDELRTRELGDMGTLRKRVAELESENKTLYSQLATLIWDRRAPGDTEELVSKVQALEGELEKLLASTATKAK